MKNFLKTHQDLITKITTSVFVFLFSVGIIYGATTVGQNIITAGILTVGSGNPPSGSFGAYVGAIDDTAGGAIYGLYATSTATSNGSSAYGLYGKVHTVVTDSMSGGANYGIYGSASVSNDDMGMFIPTGVFGESTSEGVGQNIGIYGSAANAGTNMAINGAASSAGTTNYGGYFSASEGTSNNYGIYGYAQANDSVNYGGFFHGNGSNLGTGYGVWGESGDSSNLGYGGFFKGQAAFDGTSYGIYVTTASGGTRYSGYFDGAATTTVAVTTSSETQGSCLKLKDSDGVGYTYITVNDGVITASTESCM